MSGELNQWIWDTMVSMTLLMGLVLMIRKPVSHFFGARIAYLLWILPLARLFMPTLTLEAPAATVPAVALAPMALGSEMVATVPVETSAFAALASLDWMMIAIIVWLGGAGLLFISKLAAYLQFREDIVSDGRLIGRHENIKILETAAISGPLAFGLLEKYIAVPTNFFRDYAPRERELALEHEIAHHESGDLAANFIGLTILSLHWFNPVAWFSWIAFRQDQETACDARILAQSGREVRAVYGRTIAKSVSGHRLGLASPLNQKDKIKGRLKMLGRSEKSSLRRKLGAGLVAIGTVVTLPLTATITYAEAVDPLDVSEPLAPVAPAVPPAPLAPTAPLPPAAPVAPAAPATDSDSINITMLNGRKNPDISKDYVHKVKHNGRTVILRTDKKLSEKEIHKLVAEAEASRLAADKALRDSGLDRKDRDSTMRKVERELAAAEKEMEQQWQEARLEVREAMREADQARREALAGAREAQREALEEMAPVSRLSSIFYTKGRSAPSATSVKIKGPDCVAMNKQIAIGGENGLASQAWAVVAGCGGFEVKIDKAAILGAALKGLKKERAEVEKCHDSDPDRTRKIKEIDHSIAKVKAEMAMI
ncbi:M56 family metallopeptidase [Sphingorhabdus sp. 109]|jgi:beta-lactamase regulating signal transducer with metallopeptidase domain|uniref:M56 family metallopeptidase n=1 Tax=Sphingorhabdus sp. 109 TaxID=2653173 RepID=UPI0012F12573|nr:M56 family metallopeptidase [Sphingorhabdus sp. 109]VWX59129.1 Methicillin resistance mecR1 protein [Sphingorhabdus sp. 109]